MCRGVNQFLPGNGLHYARLNGRQRVCCASSHSMDKVVAHFGPCIANGQQSVLLMKFFLPEAVEYNPAISVLNSHAQCNVYATPLSKQHSALLPSISGHLLLLGPEGGGALQHTIGCSMCAFLWRPQDRVREAIASCVANRCKYQMNIKSPKGMRSRCSGAEGCRSLKSHPTICAFFCHRGI